MQRQQVKVGLLFALALIAAACDTSINRVLADPGKYRNETTTVPGTVAESVSVLGRGAYRITDGNQGLWVVTTVGAPRKGASVTGRVQEGYDLGAFGDLLKLPGSLQTGVVLIESSHKVRD